MKVAVIQCALCTKRFKTEARYTRHLSKHSSGKLFTCPFCPMGFEYDYKLRTHIILHNGRKPYLCPVPDCKKRWPTRGALKSHLEHIHDQRNYTYSDCERFHCEDTDEVEHDLVTGSLVAPK